ncbi:MAG: isoleucine--tRNA ligase [Thalassobaculales bacterium]
MDYKSTVFLPKTDFPLRAGLPALEPKLVERWQAMDLYRRLREMSAGREKFVLHDGPPYANGHLHIGHALNKILKDLVTRTQQMLGKDSNYVPGWDCHGLPIEWKIEEQYRARGLDKDKVPVLEFRRECRESASHWIGVQAAEFQRLGVIGDWQNPYRTMDFAAEAQIFREFAKFLMNGGLYRGSKPVLWSVVEKTALADAEVEYHDHKSTTVHVAFPVDKPGHPALAGAAVAIWTTTPWTLPGNRAIAYGEGFDYAVVEVAGRRLVCAVDLVASLVKAMKAEGHTELARLKGGELAGTVCRHPWHGHAAAGGGYDFAVPLLAGGFVTLEMGTGFVHIAPGHGTDDWELGQANGIPVPFTVGPDGKFLPTVPLVAGWDVMTDNARIAEALGPALLARGTLTHSYPHSWRSKAPLIFRNTPQWFISMEANGLRDKALAAIDATRWVPASGRARIRGMIEQRPDWCISRQRAWGTPLAVFLDKETGEVLRDQRVNERIAEAFEQQGGDAWFDGDPRRFLGNDFDHDRYEAVTDVIEVWFDSGSTHGFVLEKRPDLKWPASIYLEGSDQHRGWFHSSLLVSCGTRGRAPYEAVLTHGFTMDEQGRKMSKSLGNVTAPEDVMKQYGADILRLWVVGTDYTEDQRIGPEVLKHNADLYRRLRNTLRYLLGSLDGFQDSERLPAAEMPALERFVLHRLWEIDQVIRRAVNDFDFHRMFMEVHNFCAVDLSAFYFDLRKDSLYCDRPDSLRRRACRSVLDTLFDCLTAWLAPVLCFTAEEAWLARPGAEARAASVHLRCYPEIPGAWRDDALAERWAGVRAIRRVVTGALELARAEKRIGSSLQAAPVVHLSPSRMPALNGIDLDEVFITSGAETAAMPAPGGAFTIADIDGVAAVFRASPHAKCERCWRQTPEVGRSAVHPQLCARCEDAVG